MEQWKDIPQYEKLYQVSDQGQVKSLSRIVDNGHQLRTVRERILKPSPLNKYLYVTICKEGRNRKAKINVLVLEAFVGPRPENLKSCHNNGNSEDNRLINLRWDTQQSNIQDSVSHGTHGQARKTHCPSNHAYTKANTRISSKGYRFCLACERDKNRAYERSHPGRSNKYRQKAG